MKSSVGPRGRRVARRVLRSLLSLPLFLGVCAPTLRGEEASEEVAGAWRSVVQVRGSATIEEFGAVHEANILDRREERYLSQVSLNFVLKVRPLDYPFEAPAQRQWVAVRAVATGSQQDSGTSLTGNFRVDASYSGDVADPDAFDLSISFESGEWTLGTPAFLKNSYTVISDTKSEIPAVTGVVRQQRNAIPSMVFSGIARGKPGPLSASVTLDTTLRNRPTRPAGKRARVLLSPEFEDVDVVITIDDYDTWRPKGSISSPGRAASELLVRGTLVPRNGSTDALPKVERVRFQLLDTSREPGICMNWPLAAKDRDPDLRLAMAPALTGELSDEDQMLVTTETLRDEKNLPYALAKVESSDFGARGSLMVVFELSDKRAVTGVMKGAAGDETLVRLPKMKGPDWIAEVWRTEKNVADLPADHDEESVEGQPMNGDGYTLYEEYRGWVVGGRRLEGDPEKKDYFVLNRIGADAVGGIRLFERESRIVTHDRLREAEMSAETRLMNGNYRDAPHRVDQHGVMMEAAWGTGVPDAGTDATRGEYLRDAYRPGRVKRITVEPKNLSNSMFSTARGVAFYNLSEREASFGYDRAVAHELLHSVGVDHHGEGQETAQYFFQAASDPSNKSHRVGFTPTIPRVSAFDLDLHREASQPHPTELLRTPPITLLWEDTGRDIAEELAPLFERKLAARRAEYAAHPPPANEDPGRWATQFPRWGKSAQAWREIALYDDVAYLNDEFCLLLTIGQLGQADSGHELCLMRYYFATAYPVRGKTGVYYVSRPGTNRAGRMICRSPAGTGINAASHAPQPRFGDSAPGRGGCFAQICPNDAIPPRRL